MSTKTKRRVGSALLAAIGFFAFFAVRETPAQVSGFDPEALAKQFVGYDVSRNAGKGYSESASSATLAWGESYLLNAYVKMYRVTRYTRWLDKIVDHFDRMVANMSDHDGDGIPGWHTDRYSVSRMRAEPLHNRQDGDAKIIRGWIELCRWDPRIWDIYWALFDRTGRPGLEIPYILHARAVLDGPPEMRSSDFNGDRQVDFHDFLAFARHFGLTSDSASFDGRFDLDGDGNVDFADFIAFADAFGA